MLSYEKARPRRYSKQRKNNTPIVIMCCLSVFTITVSIFLISLARSHAYSRAEKYLPMVINTWAFTDSTAKAWDEVYHKKSSALDAVESGCQVCEVLQCDGTVGFGGSPDENGETALDAMIMDGLTMNIGAVASLHRIKNAISVARHVLDQTGHTLLVGQAATDFALKMNFKEESLSTNTSINIWESWKANACQPNFWTNVSPDPKKFCGPYKPKVQSQEDFNRKYHVFNSKNHDTIGMVVIDSDNNIASGTSTNGARFKIPGRVGDSPIPGAGSYADNDVGGAAATGDGDILMRFLPSFLAVEEMRRGSTPKEAANVAISRIADKYGTFMGGIVVVNRFGEYGAACHGIDLFHYTVCNPLLGEVTVNSIKCSNIDDL